jgi:hypothetical protein
MYLYFSGSDFYWFENIELENMKLNNMKPNNMKLETIVKQKCIMIVSELHQSCIY